MDFIIIIIIIIIIITTSMGSLNSVSLLCKLPVDSLYVHSQCLLDSKFNGHIYTVS